MKKYWQIFNISFQQEFAYKLNFIMWRVRNVFQILLTFFLWSTVFTNPQTIIFGYNQTKILTYVFATMIVKAFVLSARAMDASYDISQGDLSNHLLKPISYFKYWFTRDVSSKALNILFATAEFAILFLILKPPIFLQTDTLTISLFVLAIVVAVILYFLLLFLVSSVPFWAPELGWGSHFLVTVIIIEAFSGSLFPINILPNVFQSIVMATPFPYLIYFPIQVYLGNIAGQALAGGLMIALAWVGILWFTMNFVWQKGLKVYESIGR